MSKASKQLGRIGGERVREAVETYPTRSVTAAAKMASVKGDSSAGQLSYSQVLIEESRALGDYIMRNRSGKLKKAG